MRYDYECQRCGIFEHCQAMGSDALAQCPVCSGLVERLISGGIHASVRQEATTLGQLAEKNSKALGKSKMEELHPPKKEEVSATGLTRETFRKISKMSPERKKRYILEGR